MISSFNSDSVAKSSTQPFSAIAIISRFLHGNVLQHSSQHFASLLHERDSKAGILLQLLSRNLFCLLPSAVFNSVTVYKAKEVFPQMCHHSNFLGKEFCKYIRSCLLVGFIHNKNRNSISMVKAVKAGLLPSLIA